MTVSINWGGYVLEKGFGAPSGLIYGRFRLVLANIEHKSLRAAIRVFEGDLGPYKAHI